MKYTGIKRKVMEALFFFFFFFLIAFKIVVVKCTRNKDMYPKGSLSGERISYVPEETFPNLISTSPTKLSFP